MSILKTCPQVRYDRLFPSFVCFLTSVFSWSAYSRKETATLSFTSVSLSSPYQPLSLMPSSILFDIFYSAESIQRDLTTGQEKPLWPFSAYGPAKYEPNLITKHEESPEELRVKFWQAKTQNNPTIYVSVCSLIAVLVIINHQLLCYHDSIALPMM